MMSEWTAECGMEDPFIDVPWSSGEMHWVDLRNDPQAIDAISEADEHPALLSALRMLNGPRSPVFTSKCDAWEMDADELAALRADLLLEEDVAAAGFSSYIDIVFRERSLFLRRAQLEQLLNRIDRMSRELPHSLAKLESVIRHSVVDLGTAQEGYAVTVYVKACGVDEHEAYQRWDNALRDVAILIRSLDVSSARPRG